MASNEIGQLIYRITGDSSGLKKSISERYHDLIPLNVEAINIGMKNMVPYKVEEHTFQN